MSMTVLLTTRLCWPSQSCVADAPGVIHLSNVTLSVQPAAGMPVDQDEV